MKPRDFLKEANRMCFSFETVEEKDGGTSCKGCPLDGNGCVADLDIDPDYFAMMYDAVERWSNTHQPKTRQSEFLKIFPGASLDESGVLVAKPCMMQDFACKATVACPECRKRFWLTPIDEIEADK